MAITQCRECGGKVSTGAVTCPHCGAPAPTADPQPEASLPQTPRTATPGKGKIECPYCHAIIKPMGKPAGCGTVLIALILLLFFIVPGVIYIIWESTRKACPRCLMTL
jgi:hypothetical protein